MKILFVLSGNKSNNSNLVENQAISIMESNSNIIIDYYYVKGKGIFGYLRNIPSLRNKINEFGPDIIHAHYSFCGFLSVLTLTNKPIITSLMGSDTQKKGIYFLILKFFTRFWDSAIVKSKALFSVQYKCKSYIIPNGVSLEKYKQLDKSESRTILKLDHNKKYVLFLANPNRPEKNFKLAKEAFEMVNITNKELLVISEIPHSDTNLYLSAVDLLILSSKYEGSPNVIKEAMACNLPVVSTDVGDVRFLFGNMEGYYISENTPSDFSKKIIEGLNYSEKFHYTKGRERIASIKLDSSSIARKITNIYKEILNIPLDKEKKICSVGVWDETIPGIQFDSNGISNYAKIFDKMVQDFPREEKGKLKWDTQIEEIKSNTKNKKYDCIIGISGGTDSSYLLHLAKENGLRPLAVYLDNGWASEIAVSNIEKMTKALHIDLETYVIDYGEVKDVLKSYLKAGLPWVDSPTDLAIKAILFKKAEKHGLKHVLIGHDFRTEGFQPTEWTYSDAKQMKYLLKKFRNRSTKTFPSLSIYKFFYLSYVKKIKLVRPFFYLNYNKTEAKKLLEEKYGWKDYGGHHYENIFTKFIITYWLFEKFGIDKRKITYSALILNKEMDRGEALELLKEKPYDGSKIKSDIEYLSKKLDMTTEEFDQLLKAPNHDFRDYPSYYPLITGLKKIAYPILKYVMPNKPLFIYQSEERDNS